MNILFTRHR